MKKEELKDILFKSLIIGGGILVYSTIMVTFLSDWAYSIHSLIFDISRANFDMIIYAFLGFFKMAWLVLFVIPYFAIIWSEKSAKLV